MSHETIFWEVLVFGISGLATWAVIKFKVNLMWKDFERRKKLNGDEP